MLSLALLLVVGLGFLFGSIRLFAFSLTAFLASLFPIAIVLLVTGAVGVWAFHYYQKR
ncbi:hypothetical protein [Candidatus Litorirhabdus singularis]|uniref:hypothetical protein n=1 Tax=Candidatus Litorirhabdus singularis TaxID=2518993 RepID=UPI00242DC7D3|nr:hypothetical protein [Candidatus Litorirhabdus singularis]